MQHGSGRPQGMGKEAWQVQHVARHGCSRDRLLPTAFKTKAIDMGLMSNGEDLDGCRHLST